MSYEQEFAVVDLVLASDAATRAVDAFTLSVVKMERQIRKLFTYLVYQCEAFEPNDIDELKAVLGANKHVYFDGFERGINALLPLSVPALVVDESVKLRSDACRGRTSYS